MRVLNLANKETSNIKFEVSSFPDGQQDLRILETTLRYITVTIKSRFNSFKDLELIICATKALKRLGATVIHLEIPYILGARSDREFQVGGTSYLVDVVTPIINAQGYTTVTALDPHSDVAAACINNFKYDNNVKLVEFALYDIHMDMYRKDLGDWGSVDSFYKLKVRGKENFILVSPDAGANKKIYKVAEAIGYTDEVITCSKHRDENGRLSKVKVPMGTLWESGKDAIIIDDICDGGATFLNIAKEMKANGWKGKIYLIVTHGIFSRGFSELNKYFDGIYCTNSVKDIPTTEWDGDKKDIPTQVKQLIVI